ncbi:ABC transporter permease [Kineosporia rhizophila]|uniref:ABC transporter permease n=1 Tax=Kineosporia TaxID=49184 RepID=UPI001E61AADD|nr:MULTISPECIES: ABC transporter permease [Kineosporia]MCE0536344.1 ABC transporter permease [Kineosporia rhizophila]GLY19819.1 transport permease protein [Kineosporia sp. NBRC 101677]
MASPARAVLRTEFRLFLREPGALFWTVAFPPVLFVILGLIPSFREPVPEYGGARVIDLYVPITILVTAIMASVQSMPAVLSAYREQRVLRRIATTPARPWHVLAAQFVLHGGAVVAGTALVLLIGGLAFDVSLPGAVVPYLLVLGLALAAALTIGGLVSSLSRTAKGSAAVGSAVFIAMMFTSGVWFPVQAMPDPMRMVVQATPFGAAARGMDQAALGEWPDLTHIAVLLLWTLGLGGLATRYFRWQ